MTPKKHQTFFPYSFPFLSIFDEIFFYFQQLVYLHLYSFRFLFEDKKIIITIVLLIPSQVFNTTKNVQLSNNNNIIGNKKKFNLRWVLKHLFCKKKGKKDKKFFFPFSRTRNFLSTTSNECSLSLLFQFLYHFSHMGAKVVLTWEPYETMTKNKNAA